MLPIKVTANLLLILTLALALVPLVPVLSNETDGTDS